MRVSGQQRETEKTVPHNVALEQQILGAVLNNNNLFHIHCGPVRAEHFYEPTHGRIWTLMAGRILKDHIASPVVLKGELENDPGLKDLGGVSYLARLSGAAVASFALADYVRELIETAERRRLLEVAEEIVGAINSGGTSSDAAAAMELAAMSVAENAPVARSMSLLSAHTKSITAINDAYQNGAVGVSSGLRDLDELLLLKPKRSTVLAGATSMGKTSLATWLSYHAAKTGYGVGFVSLEMGEEDLANRINSIDSRVPYQAMDRPLSETLFRKVVEAAKKQEALPIEIMSDRVRDIPAILSETRRLQAKWKPEGDFKGLGMLVIDYLQLVRGRGNAFEVLTQVSRDTKSIAKMLNIPVVALAQVSRDMSKRESKVPHLGDLRGSGDLENDADNVIFCHRPSYYLERMEPPERADDRADWEDSISASKGTMDIIVAKQRMGPLGTVRVGCDLATNRFWDLQTQTEVDF
ncbi:replicative DNA helicase [Primorskyibacter flagellatus]|uniref:DNA 5'-3' helicase n=1 Tax=Primorskyibacter flagellatus TaxID=1387277 RepID=A0A917A677_9RHOB|nr:DnaB-like helicase C-terminal domain-containing protein [Primorskyibacter flagellatus]GGE30116.1 replicative DNA helicase [Primorskyibacter flagellatus]